MAALFIVLPLVYTRSLNINININIKCKLLAGNAGLFAKAFDQSGNLLLLRALANVFFNFFKCGHFHVARKQGVCAV